jgi:hypothetical protein
MNLRRRGPVLHYLSTGNTWRVPTKALHVELRNSWQLKKRATFMEISVLLPWLQEAHTFWSLASSIQIKHVARYDLY